MDYSYVKFLRRTLSWEVATKLDIIHQTQLNVITMCRGLQLSQEQGGSCQPLLSQDRLCKIPSTYIF